MNQMFRQNLVEAVIGFVVLVVAVVAVLFFYQRTSASDLGEHYTVSALFQNAAGVNVGTDVRVSGVTVGSVVSHSLEDEFPFRAKLGLAISERYKLPLDSSASITSEGILGGTYIALSPGGAPETLRDGDQIMDTQGSVDLMSMVGQYINNTGGEGGGDSSGGDAMEGGMGSGMGSGGLEEDPAGFGTLDEQADELGMSDEAR